MDTQLIEILKAASENPQYKMLTDYLMARRAMPDIKLAGYLGDGVTGQFSTNTAFGKELSHNGQLSIVPRANLQDTIATLIHELTHAADRQMGNQYFETAKFPSILSSSRDRSQFTDAYDKLGFSDKGKTEVPTKFQQDKQDYRASLPELHGFGMGSTVAPNTHNPAPQHIDPTMATNFIQMLALAIREMQARPQSQGR